MVLDKDSYHCNDNCKEKAFNKDNTEKDNMRNILVTSRRMEMYDF